MHWRWPIQHRRHPLQSDLRLPLSFSDERGNKGQESDGHNLHNGSAMKKSEGFGKVFGPIAIRKMVIDASLSNTGDRGSRPRPDINGPHWKSVQSGPGTEKGKLKKLTFRNEALKSFESWCYSPRRAREKVLSKSGQHTAVYFGRRLGIVPEEIG